VPVGLGHHDVEPDHGGIGFGDSRDEPREESAGPRPLPVQRQARVVDRDDDRRRGGALPRRERLVRVEVRQAHLLEWREARRQERGHEESEEEDPDRSAAPATDEAHPPVLRPAGTVQVVQRSDNRSL
jgi:hypothetical protein